MSEAGATPKSDALCGTIFFHSLPVLALRDIGEEHVTLYGSYILLTEDDAVERFLANPALPNPLRGRLQPSQQQDFSTNSAWTLHLNTGSILPITVPRIDSRRKTASWQLAPTRRENAT